jgi:regulator of sigma D
VETTLSEAASILSVVGGLLLVLVGVGVYSARRLAALIEAVRPVQTLADQNLLQRISALEQSLHESSAAHRTAVEALPQRISSAVSKEVRAGLDPARQQLEGLTQQSRSLSEALGRSHDHLSQAVLTLNQDGTLGEWVASFREVVEPLQHATSAIDRHFDTAGQVLRTTSGLVEQWAAQRDAVIQAFRTFSQQVERSAAAETTHLRDIEHRLMNRLEEVSETNATVAKALSELQVAGRNALETSTDLTRSVERTGQRFAELIDLDRHTQTQHHELIRTQQQLQKDFAELERRAAQQVTALHDAVATIARTNAAAFETLHKETRLAVASLSSLLERLHQAHAASLQQLHAAQQAAAAQQDATARQQSELVERAQRLLAELPTRGHQRLSLMLLGSQVAATVVVAIAIFLLRQ